MTMLLTERWLHKSPFSLDGMALEMPDMEGDHPNRMPFQGILTQVDMPSTRAPHGSDGHRVMIPRQVAERALPSLMGMPVDCSYNLRDHDKRVVVGVITGADIVGNNVVVSGHLLGKNFPREVADIQRQKASLGMSYELSNVEVDDPQAPIWALRGFTFTGAAILLKSAAAYEDTAIVARAEEDDMSKTAEDVLKKLDGIEGQLRTLQAAQEDEDDAAAKMHEDAAREHMEAAERHLASAEAAHHDQDDEDAGTHKANAQAAWKAASEARLAAAKVHEDAAAKLRAASYDDEEAKKDAEATAKRHEEEAQRLHAAEAKAKGEAEAHASDLAAMGTQHVDKKNANWDKVCAMMLRAAMGEDADAALKKMDGKAFEAMGRAFMSMVYPSGMMTEHEDEEEDKQLMREFLRRGKMDASKTPTPNLEANRRLRKIEAATELLTDQVSKMAGLITDLVKNQRGLATDTNNGKNGGKMDAAGKEEKWVGKFDAAQETKEPAKGKMTEKELDAALDAAGIREPGSRIARKITYQTTGVF